MSQRARADLGSAVERAVREHLGTTTTAGTADQDSLASRPRDPATPSHGAVPQSGRSANGHPRQRNPRAAEVPASKYLIGRDESHGGAVVEGAVGRGTVSKSVDRPATRCGWPRGWRAHQIEAAIITPNADCVAPCRRERLAVSVYPRLNLPIWGRVVRESISATWPANPPDLIHVQSWSMYRLRSPGWRGGWGGRMSWAFTAIFRRTSAFTSTDSGGGGSSP